MDELKNSRLGRSLSRVAAKGDLLGMKPEDIFSTTECVFPEPNYHKLKNAEDIAALKLAHVATLHERSYDSWMTLVDLFQVCESPIERLFIGAFIAGAKFRMLSVGIHLHEHDMEFVRLDGANAEYQIQPQAVIGEFRVDFLITQEMTLHIPEGKDAPAGDPAKIHTQLIVECDGHDFHEKTKEQASKDKKKDRMLQACGYRVFRFTGSDIWKDPMKCSDECLDFLLRECLQEDDEDQKL